MCMMFKDEDVYVFKRVRMCVWNRMVKMSMLYKRMKICM